MAAVAAFNDATIAALTGFTTTIVAFVVGFCVPESQSFVQSQRES